MCYGVDVTTTYHAFVSKVDINIWLLLNNVQVNRRSNGWGSLLLADMVAICRYQLSGVALVPTSTISGARRAETKKGILGVSREPIVSQGEASSSIEAYTYAN